MRFFRYITLCCLLGGCGTIDRQHVDSRRSMALRISEAKQDCTLKLNTKEITTASGYVACVESAVMPTAEKDMFFSEGEDLKKLFQQQHEAAAAFDAKKIDYPTLVEHMNAAEQGMVNKFVAYDQSFKEGEQRRQNIAQAFMMSQALRPQPSYVPIQQPYHQPSINCTTRAVTSDMTTTNCH